MARLLRTTVKSHLSPPAVVGPAVVFRPVMTEQVAVARSAGRVRYAPHSKLRPPTVLATVTPVQATFRAYSDVAVWRAVERHPTRTLTPVLGLVNPATTFPGPETRLAPSNRLSRRTHSRIAPPQTFAQFVADKLRIFTKVAVWRSTERHPAKSLTPVLALVQPAVVFPAATVKLAASTRLGRRAQSKLSVPATLAAVFVPPPPRVANKTAVWRAVERHPANTLTPVLALVQPATTFQPPQTRLARQPRAGRRTQWFLRPPVLQVVQALAPPIRALLAKARPPRQVQHSLRAPAVVGQPFVAGSISTSLTQPARKFYRTSSLTPVLGLVAPAVVFRPVKTRVVATGTARTQHRLVVSTLGPPATLEPPPPSGVVARLRTLTGMGT